MGDLLPNHPPALPSGAFAQSDNPPLERSVVKNKGQFGRVRRLSRLSRSESSGAEEEGLGPSADVTSSYARSPVLQGTPAQGGLYHRSAFEQAESRAPSNGDETLPSSPRSWSARSYFSSQAGPAHGQHPNKGRSADAVKAFGAQPPQRGRGRNRTSSETEARARSSRTPTQRKRGLSETESRPMRDKYDRPSREGFRSACLWLYPILNITSNFWMALCSLGLFNASVCFSCQLQTSEHVSVDAGHLFFLFVFCLNFSVLVYLNELLISWYSSGPDPAGFSLGEAHPHRWALLGLPSGKHRGQELDGNPSSYPALGAVACPDCRKIRVAAVWTATSPGGVGLAAKAANLACSAEAAAGFQPVSFVR